MVIVVDVDPCSFAIERVKQVFRTFVRQGKLLDYGVGERFFFDSQIVYRCALFMTSQKKGG